MPDPKATVYAHPFVGILFDEMARRGWTAADVAKISGVSAGNIRAWKERTNPNLSNLEACLNAVGLQLAVLRK